MAEKKATERAAAQQEAKAPEKAASPAPAKETGAKQEEQSQSPKRRGRPPKADYEKTVLYLITAVTTFSFGST